MGTETVNAAQTAFAAAEAEDCKEVEGTAFWRELSVYGMLLEAAELQTANYDE